MKMNAIFILSGKTDPPKLYLDFISKLKNEKHDIFLVVDHTNQVHNVSSSVQVMQCLSQEATSHGYWDWAFADRNNTSMMQIANPCSWEKAFYFHLQLAKQGKNYEHVWIVETDVFIPHANIFTVLDEKYHDADLLTGQNILYEQIRNGCGGRTFKNTILNCPSHTQEAWFA